MSKQFVSVYCPQGQTKYIDAQSLEGRTVASIQNENPATILFIKTPRFIKRMEKGVIPLDKYPDLRLDQKGGAYDTYPYMLFYSPPSQEYNFYISVTPICSGFTDIPNFYVRFDPATAITMSLSAFIEEIVANFGFKVLNPTISIGSEAIDESNWTNPIQIGERAETEEFFFKFDPNEELKKTIKMRVLIVNEIITTEKTYTEDLSTLNNFWYPAIRDSGKINKDDMDIIFKNLPPVLGCHNTFYDSIKDCTKYSSQIAPKFIDFAQLFKFAQTYIANYPAITTTLKKYDQSKEIFSNEYAVKKLMKKLQSECKDRDFASYLITPVQRMPRYILFIRELKKYTPMSHPDYGIISVAYNEIERVTNSIDVASNTAKIQQRLFAIQKNSKKQIKFINNKLILEQLVNVTEKQNTLSGSFLLFDDYLVILKTNKKGVEKIIYDSSLHTFSYIPNPNSKTSIIIDTSEKEYSKGMFKTHDGYVIDFKSEENWKKVKDSYTTRLKGIMLRTTAMVPLVFTNPNIQLNFPAFTNHVAIRVSHRVYVFSGKDFTLVNYINTKEHDEYKMRKVDIKLPHLKNPLVTRHLSSICIISNQTLYMIEAKTNSLSSSNVITGSYKPRTDSTIVTYQGQFYVFGGRGKNLLNDFQHITLDKDTNQALSELITSPNAPSPRCKHSAIVHDDCMYIFGGETSNGDTNDLYVYDFTRCEWSQIENNLKPSSGHKCVNIGKTLFFIGGTGTFQIFDLSTKKEETFELFGNVPINLTGTQALVDKDSDILMIGGYIGKNKTPAPCMWIIKVPDLIKKKENTEPVRKIHNGGACGGKTDIDFDIVSDSVSEFKPSPPKTTRPKVKPDHRHSASNANSLRVKFGDQPKKSAPVEEKISGDGFRLEDFGAESEPSEPKEAKTEEPQKVEEKTTEEETVNEKPVEQKEEKTEEPKKEQPVETMEQPVEPKVEEPVEKSTGPSTATVIVTAGIAIAAIVGTAYLAYKHFKRR